MSDCTHDCSSCKDTCEKKDFLAKPREDTRIKKIIAVVSGKGGVGKSMVTDLLATPTSRVRPYRRLSVLQTKRWLWKTAAEFCP